MQLIFDAEGLNWEPKMSIMQASAPTPENLPTEPPNIDTNMVNPTDPDGNKNIFVNKSDVTKEELKVDNKDMEHVSINGDHNEECKEIKDNEEINSVTEKDSNDSLPNKNENIDISVGTESNSLNSFEDEETVNETVLREEDGNQEAKIIENSQNDDKDVQVLPINKVNADSCNLSPQNKCDKNLDMENNYSESLDKKERNSNVQESDNENIQIIENLADISNETNSNIELNYENSVELDKNDEDNSNNCLENNEDICGNHVTVKEIDNVNLEFTGDNSASNSDSVSKLVISDVKEDISNENSRTKPIKSSEIEKNPTENSILQQSDEKENNITEISVSKPSDERESNTTIDSILVPSDYNGNNSNGNTNYEPQNEKLDNLKENLGITSEIDMDDKKETEFLKKNCDQEQTDAMETDEMDAGAPHADKELTENSSKTDKTKITNKEADDDVTITEQTMDVDTSIDLSHTEDIVKDNINVANVDVLVPNKDENDKKKLVAPPVKRTSMLANNLEIFSDEEEEETKNVNEFPIKQKDNETDNTDQNKNCVSLVDDDDDIMLIDDDTNSKPEQKANIDSNENSLQPSLQEKDETSISNSVPVKDISDKPAVNEGVVATEKSDSELQTERKVEDDKPLVAKDFLKNFKTKMGEMTRADLEEFCLIKIVEGVIDRSNLSEIKAKLKTMMQNVEEWRRKSLVLNKQNRDLQIVLRTVQEEQKKKSDEVITPLKITRSVGMQVLMVDNKSDSISRPRNQKRFANNTTTQKNQPPKIQMKNTKNIPVPRLVPASPTKPSPVKTSPQVQNSTVTSNSGAVKVTTPPAVKTYQSVKTAEKRPLSDSIDLTDDEPMPPAKKPPVRLVPSQQLMAPGRSSIVNNSKPNTGNPRQVYIPIGSQPNIRPGQQIVYKTGGVRTRAPNPGTVRGASPATRPTVVRQPNKHPAPLPQAYSQPQPPNWKALPPAPDLKISKIENGIVVSWKIDGYQESSYEEIVSYQLYAYQETSAPASTFLWNKIGDIKALPLPMACTLTQFIAGYKYYFAVRAVDIRSRIGPFSLPGSILLLNK